MSRREHREIALYELGPAPGDAGLPGFALIRPAALTIGVLDTGAPHRHDFHEIILVETGTALHTIDGQVYRLEAGQAACVGQGRIHLMLQMNDLTGWIFRFASGLLLMPPHSVEAAAVARLFSPLAVTQTLALPDADVAQCVRLASVMADELARPAGEQPGAVVRHLMLALVLRLVRHLDPEPVDERLVLPEYQIYQGFLLALERDFRAHHDVRHYEVVLGQGAQRLSRALARAVGKSAKQLIAERLTLEAQRLLTYTSRSMKEIASELGFRDQFQFSRAFKAQTGLPPLAFRER